MIRLEHVSKDYLAGSGLPALNDVNMKIEDGEFVFIVGDSGSGKSTLIKLLLKELEPTSGTIVINGRKLNKIRRRQIPKFRREIGVVFQDFRLLKDRNVYNNVAFAQKVIGESTRMIRCNVPNILSKVGLAAKYRSYPRQLSGGEQQRVAIARALINRPKILLADEPTGNLDNTNAWDIMKLMEEINNDGTTIVVVTHNLEIVSRMNKRVIQMNKGVIVDDSGRPDPDVKDSASDGGSYGESSAFGENTGSYDRDFTAFSRRDRFFGTAGTYGTGGSAYEEDFYDAGPTVDGGDDGDAD